MTEIAETFDYVVVGGGTAGCVLAARLSEKPAIRVLMLEAGPPPQSLWIRMPAGMGRLFVNSPFNWGLLGDPEPQLDDRAIYIPQGKTLGGSSSINGMAFVRGQAEDYQSWTNAGAIGWGWNDVLPYFKRIEERGANALRGAVGKVRVSDPDYVHPSTRAFCEAAQASGIPANSDYNGTSQEGVSLLQFSIRNGARESSATAYLKAARKRPNLRILTGAQAERILFDGLKASGIAYRFRGKLCKARVTREVIVTSGAFGSPALLLRSGIGAGADLSQLDIPVIHELPGVGSNLIDHPYLHMTFGVERDSSLNTQLLGWRPYLHGARWLFSKRGPLTIGASQAAAFVCSNPALDRPDTQINFRPISHVFDDAGRLTADPMPRITAGICGLRPRSRGRVWLKSPNGDIGFVVGYLNDKSDEDVLVAGFRWVRRIFSAEPLRSIICSEDKPGTDIFRDEQIREFVRATVQSMIHPVGTCRMGQDDMAVVDARLRVRGIGSVRIIDSSIMPEIVSGNTAAATYMIAEKGADMVIEDCNG